MEGPALRLRTRTGPRAPIDSLGAARLPTLEGPARVDRPGWARVKFRVRVRATVRVRVTTVRGRVTTVRVWVWVWVRGS